MNLSEFLWNHLPKWSENFTGIPLLCDGEGVAFMRQLEAIFLAIWLGLLLACVIYSFFKKYAERFISLDGASRSFVLVLSSFILVFLFMNPPTTVDKNENLEPTENNACKEEKEKIAPTPNVANRLKFVTEKSLDKLLELEVKKVFDEIQARISHIDSWYHWKFILIGSVIAAFITGFPRRLKDPLHQTINPTAASLLLASSCMIAFAADIHMRIEGAMTGMLGRWISDYVEPIGKEMLYWETYLRTGQALHTSLITQFTFAPHLHFLTWPVYISYIWIFQEIALQGQTENIRLVKGSFVLVQTSLFIFVLVAHSTPLAYGLTVFKFPPGYVFALFIGLYFVIVALSTPYFAIAGKIDSTKENKPPKNRR